MRKIVLLFAGCALAALPAVPVLAATPANGLYVSGHLGVAMPSDSKVTDSTAPGVSMNLDFDAGLALGLAVGYRLGSTRLEGEIAYQKNDVDDVTVSVAGVGSASLNSAGVPFSADVKTTSFLLNGYYDFLNDSAFTPYLTAGLGFAKVKASISLPSVPWTTSDSDTVFAYQIGAGLENALSQTVALDARYRYFATSDPSFGTNEAETGSHNLMLGMRFSF